MTVPSPDPSLASCHTSPDTRRRNRRYAHTAGLKMTTAPPTGHRDTLFSIWCQSNLHKCYSHNTVFRDVLTKLPKNDNCHNTTAIFHEVPTSVAYCFSPLWRGLPCFLLPLGDRVLWVFYCPLTWAGCGHTDESLTQTRLSSEAWSSLFLQTEGNRHTKYMRHCRHDKCKH